MIYITKEMFNLSDFILTWNVFLEHESNKSLYFKFKGFMLTSLRTVYQKLEGPEFSQVEKCITVGSKTTFLNSLDQSH